VPSDDAALAQCFFRILLLGLPDRGACPRCLRHGLQHLQPHRLIRAEVGEQPLHSVIMSSSLVALTVQVRDIVLLGRPGTATTPNRKDEE
jgi:hypothetical protein